MATPMREDSSLVQRASMSTDDVIRAPSLIDTEIRVLKEELQRTNLELDSFKRKFKKNQEKIKLDKQVPDLVGNAVEILEVNPEEDGANIDLDSQRKGKCVVLRTSTRQTIGLVDPVQLIRDTLPSEYDSPSKDLEVNEKPTENYYDIGGLEKQLQQIQELVEAIVLSMTHKEQFQKLGTIFLPVVGIVDLDKLKPGDLVAVNKDSYLILDTLPSEYDVKPTEDSNDIGGLEKQIQELVEAIVLPMTHKDWFQKLGIRPPKGVLLYGPPGTGKTLMACAAQTNATFLKLARPQLVKSIAASTRADILDPVLMRSGLLDRKTVISHPSEKARATIQQVNLSNFKNVNESCYILILSFVALVGFILWLFGRKKPKRRRVDRVKSKHEEEMKVHQQKGFGNLKSTCYLGVTLQTFLSLDCLKTEFDRAIEFGRTTSALKQVLYGNGVEVIVEDITPLVRSLDSTKHHVNTRKDGSILALFSYIMEDIIELENPTISNLFKTYIHQVKAFTCQCPTIPEERIKNHIYMHRLPAKGESVTEALNSLFQTEYVSTKQKCPKCKEENDYTVSWLLAKPASVLVLELKYNNNSSGYVTYEDNLTIYPKSCIERDLEEGVHERISYQLKSVIQTKRIKSRNHFTAYVRRMIKNVAVWFETNDEVVKKVETRDVFKVKRPTLLVYERIL